MVFFGTLRTFLASLCLHTHLHYACLALVLLYAPGSGSSLPSYHRPTSLSVLFAYHTNPSACCRWILRYSFSRASLLSFPLFFISLPPIPDALSIQLIPMCGYHSQSLCIQYKSFVFFLFRWYMISSSILSVVSNINPPSVVSYTLKPPSFFRQLYIYSS